MRRPWFEMNPLPASREPLSLDRPCEGCYRPSCPGSCPYAPPDFGTEES